MAADLFIGIDLGTQGLRVLVVDESGELISSAQRKWPVNMTADGRHEQNPQFWWSTLREILREALSGLGAAKRAAVRAIAVASTSGTVIPIDGLGNPLAPAILYSDRRAAAEAEAINEVAGDYIAECGCKFRSSFALPKILWIKKHKSALYEATRWFVHPADWLTGKISGLHGISDMTNVFKAGYNLSRERWASFISSDLGVEESVLPEVRRSGEVLGTVSTAFAAEFSLPGEVVVVAGMTDANAVHLASGSAQVGDWTTTMGSAMGIKGISEKLIPDPSGVIYSHRHPDGGWIPGGASNIGGASLNHHFDPASFETLNSALPDRPQTDLLVYPLQGVGDWFPFWAPTAEGFQVGTAVEPLDRYAAVLEGISFIESIAYESMERSGFLVGETIYSVGGANRSAPWLQMRSSILQKEIALPVEDSAAMGAAILAASAIGFPSVAQAARGMTRFARKVCPDSSQFSYYAAKRDRFVSELSQRGYLTTQAITETL